MLLVEITFGLNCDAAGFRLFWLMVVGSPVRAVMIGSISKSRSHHGPFVRYCSAAVRLLVRSNSERERSKPRYCCGNCPTFNPVGCEKLNNPSPSSIDFDQV